MAFYDTDVMLLGLATVLWAIAMVANRLLGPSRRVRIALYVIGLGIIAYAFLQLGGRT